MNRQLKFRIWDNEQKKFEYFELNNITVPDRLLTQDKFPVQQSTGIKDCKGVEIYEGDRIEFYSKDRKIYYYGEIDFTEGAFLVKIVGNEGTLQWFWMYHLNDYEQIRVVGNIFELPCNPDHNGECLVCDCWLSDCPFNKRNEQQEQI